MSRKAIGSIKRRSISTMLALSMVFSGLIGIPDNVQVQAATTYDYNLADSIQDGVILQCFDWTYNDIKNELPNIAAAGFTSVQTSPAQPSVKSGVWYWMYQPLGFYVGSNNIGTKSELQSLCTEAEKYGINVIVDVVANHLAGDHSNIQSDLKDSQYWHTYGATTDWKNRYAVTQGDIGMADINSEHSYVQQVVSNYVSELKNIGVDGIRWDAAKHIALPSEGCNFWPAVTGQGLYNYGEILVGPDDRKSGNEYLMKEYTNYMSVTDSAYGKDLRDAFASGTVLTAFANWAARGISNNKLVYWGESHDTWSNDKAWGYSNEMSQNVIDRAYAIAASRNDITAVYFSRPSSASKESIIAGQKGSTHFTSAEVAEINKFHNAMDGQADYYTTGSNCAAVCRKTGAVVVAGSGSNFNVTVPNGGSLTEAGAYVDAISGEKWTVTSTTMTGKIGSTGIVVLYKEGTQPTDPVVTAGTVYYQNTSNWSSVYAYYWSDDNTKMTTWPGVQMTSEGDGVYSVKIPEGAKYVIFNNGSGTQTDDLTLAGINKIYNNGTWSDYSGIVISENYIYYQNTNNWGSVYAYYWSDDNTEMTTWPGKQMICDGDGVYRVEINSAAKYIIFNNGEGWQTEDISLNGMNQIYNNGSWSAM